MSAERAVSSPWTLHSPYWIVLAGDGAGDQPWHQAAQDAGLHKLIEPGMFAIQTTPEWVHEWERVLGALQGIGGHEQVRAAVIGSNTAPSIQEIRLNLKPLHVVQEITEHLWLLDHMSEDRLVCFMQRVVDRRGKDVGYEAFARIQKHDDGIIGGAAIMRASHALKVEYQIDRRMHKVAIDTFADCDLSGYLFINFLTGFIHRPEVYLDGLSQAVSRHGITPRQIVLDVPITDYARDIPKLRSIADYCRVRGFSLAFDDVYHGEGLSDLLTQIRPAFLKLDARLASAFANPMRTTMLYEIIRQAHSIGASVLAEGVESAALLEQYMAAGVDMFQGYHFGAPERMPAPCAPHK